MGVTEVIQKTHDKPSHVLVDICQRQWIFLYGTAWLKLLSTAINSNSGINLAACVEFSIVPMYLLAQEPTEHP